MDNVQSVAQDLNAELLYPAPAGNATTALY